LSIRARWRSWPGTGSGWQWCASGARPRAAAERELAEECGLAAAQWEEGPSFYTAPGFSTELLTVFLATETQPVVAVAPDDEALERSWLSLPDALDAIDDGGIRDAKSLVAILWMARRRAAAPTGSG